MSLRAGTARRKPKTQLERLESARERVGRRSLHFALFQLTLPVYGSSARVGGVLNGREIKIPSDDRRWIKGKGEVTGLTRTL